jgi:hypothetical protein
LYPQVTALDGTGVIFVTQSLHYWQCGGGPDDLDRLDEVRVMVRDDHPGTLAV